MVECTSRTVEDGGREHLFVVWTLTKACLSRPNAFHSRLTKPPSSRSCSKHCMGELDRHGLWNQHTKLSYDGNIVSSVVVEKLCGATVTLFEPRLEDTVLDAHTREPITVITQRYPSVLHFRICRWLSLCAIKNLRSLMVLKSTGGLPCYCSYFELLAFFLATCVYLLNCT